MPKLTHSIAFEQAHAHVAKWEGGLSDHPNDPGGVTNYGVSIAFLKGLPKSEADINGDGVIDRNDVLAITPEKAKELFKRYFWTNAKAEKLPPLVAMAYYDFGVNSGAGRAAIVLQEAINKLYPGAIAKTAANVGPLTQFYCKQLADAGKERELVDAYIDGREAFLRGLAAKRPASNVFLAGWINRLNDLRKLIAKTADKYGVK